MIRINKTYKPINRINILTKKSEYEEHNLSISTSSSSFTHPKPALIPKTHPNTPPREFASKNIEHRSSFTIPTESTDELYRKYFSFVKNKPSTVIFLHSCNIGNLEVLDGLCKLIISTGLIQKVDWIYVNNVGQELPSDYFTKFEQSSKFVLNNYSTDANLFELPTLYLLKVFSMNNKRVKVLYLHTKGISRYYDKNLTKNIKAWTDYMTYFLIEKHDECIKFLDTYYTVGVNLLKNHYSGNFWWAMSDYLAIVNGRMVCKYDAEWWILSRGIPSKYCTLHDIGVLYHTYYPRNKYAIY
jgi:hypothetical protein